MVTKRLTPAEQPAAISDRKASLLCRERATIDDKRLDLGRQADALRKRIDAIDAELAAYVDANKTGKSRTVTLARWRLSIVQVPRSVYWLRELTQRIGQAAIDELRRSAGTKDQLEVEAL